MKRLLFIAIAGAAGSLARYGLSSGVQKMAGGTYPWGTFAVNMIGCFLFGYVWSLDVTREAISSETRAILLIGFMGAFTTFSSFAYDNFALIRDNQWVPALINIAAQNVIGVAALWAGVELAKRLP